MVDPNASEWLKKQQKASRKTRIIVSTLGITVLVLVLGGVTYALIHKGTGGGSGDGSSSSTNGGPNGGGGRGSYTPNDPNGPYYTWDNKPVNLTITPDPRLHQSFYGLNYGPVNGSYPWCTNTLGDVIEDIKFLSQLTNRLRLYGMDCNVANWTLLAIKLLKVQMTIIPTIWVDNNITTYDRQYNDFFNTLQEHGVDNIDGVSVGNEVIFHKAINTSDLYSRIADVRSKLRKAYPSSYIPVFTSDIGSNIDAAFVQATDVAFANVHPYFGGVNVSIAANWTFDFFNRFDVTPATKGGKEAVISEIGWPTAGSSQQNSIPSVSNLQTFLNTFICTANFKGTRYYYFESFDTPWKVAFFSLLEGSWGLFNPDRSFKPGIILPNCQVTAGGFAES